MKKPKHSSRTHAPIAPSALKRLMECPGSYTASCGVPEGKPSEAAMEGIIAHEWAERLRGACQTGDPNDYAKELLSLENYDDDMAYHIDNYIEFLDKLKSTFQSDKYTEYNEYIETRVAFTENNWGTLDYACIRSRRNRHQALIADLKYGRGTYVPVKDNPQLINYLICLEEHLGLKFHTAWLYIYQPRIDKEKPYEVMKITQRQIQDWRHSILFTEKRCLDMRAGKIEPEYKAGDHCQFCPAQAIPWPNGSPGCPTFRARMQSGALKILDSVDNLPAIEDAPIAALVELHKRKKEIKHYLENVDHFLLVRGLKRQDIGDLRVVEGQSVRRWNDDEEDVAAGLKRLGCQPWRRKLITIGQAEKIIGKKKLDHLTNRPPGKLQLALPNDKRRKAQIGKNSLDLLD